MSDYRNRDARDGFNWGIPVAIVVGLLVVGVLWFFVNASPQQQATTNTGTPFSQLTPPGTAAPAPSKTRAPTQ